MFDKLVCEVSRPGIELIHYQGGPGYGDEQIELSNGVSNGLRFEILNDDLDGRACFHIHDRETAIKLAAKLVEWCERIADPPPAPTAGQE